MHTTLTFMWLNKKHIIKDVFHVNMLFGKCHSNLAFFVKYLATNNAQYWKERSPQRHLFNSFSQKLDKLHGSVKNVNHAPFVCKQLVFLHYFAQAVLHIFILNVVRSRSLNWRHKQITKIIKWTESWSKQNIREICLLILFKM